MNQIPPDVFNKADKLFIGGFSIRQVMRTLGISRETAHRIQKYSKLKDIEMAGGTWVNTGRDKSGKITGYESAEMRPHWKRQHYSRIEEKTGKTPWLWTDKQDKQTPDL